MASHCVQSNDLVRTLLATTKESVDYFFHQVDPQEISRCIESIVACQGMLFVTGVGKSGIIARKIATTMNSLGTKAIFLSPLDALHGDIGQVSAGDVVLLFSKSGETRELLDLCPSLRHKGAKLIAVVSNKTSHLGSLCDSLVYLPISKELCPYDLVPTTSTLIQLMFGDIAAVSLMYARGFSKDEFAKNHPAGRLGRRLILKVSDLMLSGKQVPLVDPENSLSQILVELSDKRCGCVVVVNQNKELLGIFTDGDLRRALQKYGTDVFQKPIYSMMTPRPKEIAPSELAYEAMKLMERDPQHPVTVLIVVENEKVVGLVRMHDIIQAGI